MKKIFGTANEKYLRAGIVYFNSTDSILYHNYDASADTKYTNAVTKDELINLFNKGILVVDNGSNFVRPTVLTVATAYAGVSHTTVGASDKAVATSYYSKGYTAG